MVACLVKSAIVQQNNPVNLTKGSVKENIVVYYIAIKFMDNILDLLMTFTFK